MTEEKTPRDQARILASVGTHSAKRFATPIQVAEDIEANRSKYPTKKALAEAYNFRDSAMVDRFLSLLRLPEEIKERVAFQGKDTNLGLDKAYRISRLKSQADMLYLGSEILNSDLSTSEVRQIQILKRRNDGIPIDECVKMVKEYRTSVEETNVVVANLRPDARGSLDQNSEKRKKIIEGMKSQLENLVNSPGDLRYVNASGGKLFVALSSDGYSDLRSYAASHKKTFTELFNEIIEQESNKY